MMPLDPNFLRSALTYNPSPGPNLSFAPRPGSAGQIPGVATTGGNPMPAGPSPAPTPAPAPMQQQPNPFIAGKPGEAMSLEDKLAQAKQVGVSNNLGNFIGAALMGSTVASPMGPFKAAAGLGLDHFTGLADKLGIDPNGNINQNPGWNNAFDRAAKIIGPRAQPQAVIDLAKALTTTGPFPARPTVVAPGPAPRPGAGGGGVIRGPGGGDMKGKGPSGSGAAMAKEMHSKGKGGY